MACGHGDRPPRESFGAAGAYGRADGSRRVLAGRRRCRVPAAPPPYERKPPKPIRPPTVSGVGIPPVHRALRYRAPHTVCGAARWAMYAVASSTGA
ncbi:hypothetical protein CU044_2641 [Streptomyces sp. L-9-10]|nr:hypothetical protein CU044_2641 [Streptomyces sp. L-9-10]